MSILSSKELERLRYRQGQVVRSRDFRDQVAIEAQLRWWHNRALHNVFGVSLGLKTSPLPENGPVTAVRVACGLAYDCFGRELILQNTQEIPVPEVSPDGNAMTLFIRYKDAARFPKRDEASGVCVETKHSLFQEQTELIWKTSKQVTFTDGVPLAIVEYESSVPSLDEEFAAPYSRPLARPRIAGGSSIAGSTAWEVWEKQGVTIGFQARIDASAAGFTEIPCYFAWLQGALQNQNGTKFFLTPFVHIDEPSINGFVFRLWMPTRTISRVKTTSEDFKNKFPVFAQTQRLFVYWLGIQPPHGDNQKK